MKPYEMEVKYQFFTPQIQMLEGEMLTLVDASIGDPQQRKALKDIVRQTVWGWAIRENLAIHDPHNHVKK